jgi:hypothetical protein
VAIGRSYGSVRELLGETLDLSMAFGTVWRALDGEERQALTEEISAQVAPFAGEGGRLRLPGRSLGIAASA